MSDQEILEKIEQLQLAANGLYGTSRVFKLDDLKRLKLKLEEMSRWDIVDRVNELSLQEIAELNQAIDEAASPVNSHIQRIEGFNKAFRYIESALGVFILQRY